MKGNADTCWSVGDLAHVNLTDRKQTQEAIGCVTASLGNVQSDDSRWCFPELRQGSYASVLKLVVVRAARVCKYAKNQHAC